MDSMNKHISFKTIQKAKSQILGICLIDTKYANALPASMQLSDYDDFILALIRRGMGLRWISIYLEAHYEVINAHVMIVDALNSVPDNADLPTLFNQVLKVLNHE